MSAERSEDLQVRLVRPGEGAAVVALVAGTHDAAAAAESPLRAALDVHGGQLPLGADDVPGGLGWCFGAYRSAGLVGMLYACAPVKFIRSFPPEQREGLVCTVMEIEIIAVDEQCRQRGVATALLRHAEAQFVELGVRYLVAKVDATAMSTLRWYRHRGYTLAREDEDLVVETPDGSAGLDAGDSARWRLAVKAPGKTITRRGAGLRSHLTLADG